MKIEQKHFDAMISGKKCKFWNGLGAERSDIILGIQMTSHPYIDSNRNVWSNCEPIETVRYLKELVKLMQALVEGGWKPTEDGEGFYHDRCDLYFNNKMFRDCGKPEHKWLKNWTVDPSWVEEREE